MRTLVRRHIETAVDDEWPAMARQHATLTVVPTSLAQALHLALALTPRSEGQKVAQREMVAALESALDARRQRIIVSESRVTWAKWAGDRPAGCPHLARHRRRPQREPNRDGDHDGHLRLGGGGVPLLIASQDRPFSGPFAVKPNALVQVMPGAR